jgi:hypothetical protein
VLAPGSQSKHSFLNPWVPREFPAARPRHSRAVFTGGEEPGSLFRVRPRIRSGCTSRGRRGVRSTEGGPRPGADYPPPRTRSSPESRRYRPKISRQPQPRRWDHSCQRFPYVPGAEIFSARTSFGRQPSPACPRCGGISRPPTVSPGCSHPTAPSCPARFPHMSKPPPQTSVWPLM